MNATTHFLSPKLLNMQLIFIFQHSSQNRNWT